MSQFNFKITVNQNQGKQKKNKNKKKKLDKNDKILPDNKKRKLSTDHKKICPNNDHKKTTYLTKQRNTTPIANHSFKCDKCYNTMIGEIEYYTCMGFRHKFHTNCIDGSNAINIVVPGNESKVNYNDSNNDIEYLFQYGWPLDIFVDKIGAKPFVCAKYVII